MAEDGHERYDERNVDFLLGDTWAEGNAATCPSCGERLLRGARRCQCGAHLPECGGTCAACGLTTCVGDGRDAPERDR